MGLLLPIFSAIRSPTASPRVQPPGFCGDSLPGKQLPPRRGPLPGFEGGNADTSSQTLARTEKAIRIVHSRFPPSSAHTGLETHLGNPAPAQCQWEPPWREGGRGSPRPKITTENKSSCRLCWERTGTVGAPEKKASRSISMCLWLPEPCGAGRGQKSLCRECPRSQMPRTRCPRRARRRWRPKKKSLHVVYK